MLLTRVITAAVLLVVLMVSIWMGPLAFGGVMAIAFGAALYEWLRIGGLGRSSSSVVSAAEMATHFFIHGLAA